jgi:predicted lactoylglutathione lyase/uncharacterized protein YndB with AHSA1/START domain
MNGHLKFDFAVNTDTNSVHIKREFDAGIGLVWEAWTNPEILDQWWAPKPYRNITKSMDFREGGMWLYSMISPKDEVHWCKAAYQNIKHQTSYSFTDNFCDENGNVNGKFPDSFWTNVFSENAERTSVSITIQYESLGALQKVVEIGFRDGLKTAMENLDSFLSHKKMPADKMVSINLPVENLQRSMDFYSALGFENYPYTLGDTVSYMFWSQHISLTLMTREKFASLVPKPLADTRQTMGSFFTLSVSSLDELNTFMAKGLRAGGVEPNTGDDYGFMHQRTLEDFDGHCWNVLFIDVTKMQAEEPNK